MWKDRWGEYHADWAYDPNDEVPVVTPEDPFIPLTATSEHLHKYKKEPKRGFRHAVRFRVFPSKQPYIHMFRDIQNHLDGAWLKKRRDLHCKENLKKLNRSDQLFVKAILANDLRSDIMRRFDIVNLTLYEARINEIIGRIQADTQTHPRTCQIPSSLH